MTSFLLQMNFLSYVCILAVPLGTVGKDFSLEYYETVSLDCNESNYNFTSSESVTTRYWLVPDGNLISDSQQDGHYEIDSNFTLTVHRISDNDFGHYFCLLVRSNYTVDRIVHGVNVDGPYFGDLLEKYKKNAIIGGIAAGSLFVIVAGSCLVWQLRYQQRSNRNKAVDELDKAIDGYDLRAYDNVGIEGDGETDEKSSKEEGSSEKDDKL